MFTPDIYPTQLRIHGGARHCCVQAAVAALMGLSMGAPALADCTSPSSKKQPGAEYKATVIKAEAEYGAAKARCDSMSVNQKNVCIKAAKAAEKKVKGDAKTSSPREAGEENHEVEYISRPLPRTRV